VKDARVALVTGVGGRSGIAAAVSAALLRDGWSVFATGNRQYAHEQPHSGDDDLDALIAELAADGRFHWRDSDLADVASIPSLFDAAEAAFGPVDALVAAHARSLLGGLLEVTPQEFDRHLAVNAKGTLFLMAEFAKRWRGEGRGSIVAFVSGLPLPGEMAYAASKGAIEWLTVSAAAELAPRGITVNAIDPGPTDTGWMSEALAATIDAKSPLGRIGRPSDAAELVAFLCLERGGWITGQVIHSDGGWGALR
jgi:3-oxoacyl-[acyl-carrier protein] reductase